MKEKILLVSCEGLGKGGVQSVIMSIVRNMSYKYVFDIILFTDEKRFYDDEFESYGGKIFRIPNYNGENKIRKKIDYYIRRNRIYRETKNIIKSNGPYRAIHCNNVYESGICLKAAYKYKIKTRIVHIHIVPQPGNFIRNFIDKNYFKFIKQFGEHFIGCSEDSCKSFYGKKVKYNVINNPYNEDIFKFSPNISNNELIITQIGSFSSNKNQVFSIKVLSHIVKKYPNAKLYFVGFDIDGYQNEMEAEITKSGLKNNIKIYPSDTNISLLLKKTSALIFPSLVEGFGIVLIEAQAMGVRCYVSDSVTKQTNVGGCEFISLKIGAENWAEKIINDYKITLGKHYRYDCSEFSTKETMKNYELIYRGGSL
ncbi:MAG: glycosyltransferase [Clostridium sp.]|nr:glycosyltransferase [Clostridium sp.]